MKNAIQINRTGKMTASKRDSIIRSQHTVNLNNEITRKDRYTRRKITKYVNVMPFFAKTISIIAVLMIMIGSLTNLNATEEIYNEVNPADAIINEIQQEVDDADSFVAEIEKELLEHIKENPESVGVTVTAIVEPTTKNGGLKNDTFVILEAVRFLKKWEGTYTTAYWDVKRYSICNGTPSFKGEVVTEAECDKRLIARIKTELLRINRTGDNLHYRKKIALISFYFNTGYNHKVQMYAIKGDDKSVKYLMSLFNTAGGKFLQGLQNRRYAEIKQYSLIK